MKRVIYGKKLYKFIYDGPVYDGEYTLCKYSRTTSADSEAEACRNILYWVKKDHGLPLNYPLTLDMHSLSLLSTNENPLEGQDAYCDSCGRLLNDGGTCPVCDDGEEDY